ncbi:ARM repeat-containing protein [Ramicandelaber brevisporus]|nr:ARM repeat-containing protein [Ramicandelaber brevisporus]
MREAERQAVGDLLDYLERRDETDFYHGEPLSALTTLAFSDTLDLQRSVAMAFAEITENDARPCGREFIEPIMYLLQSHDMEVQGSASSALGSLACVEENKVALVKMGVLDPLIRLMLSTNPEAQINAAGCLTNLATIDENKYRIAKSGALIPLTRLARSRDIRVQRNAAGALLNMTHTPENRAQLVNAGALPVLVNLLGSSDVDVQYYSATALSNIAVDAPHRRRLAQTEPRLVSSFIMLLNSQSPRVQCQAALGLRNLASDEKFQYDIVATGGLPPLLRLLQSPNYALVLSAIACLRNLSIHTASERPIIEAGFLPIIVELLRLVESEELQGHAICTIRNIAAASENKEAVAHAGAIEAIVQSMPHSSEASVVEMAAVLAILGHYEEHRAQMLTAGALNVLLPLTLSDNPDIASNCGATVCSLSTQARSYIPFVEAWHGGGGGLRDFLLKFLNPATSPLQQHIGTWTLVQLLEAADPQLCSLLLSDEELLPMVTSLSDNIGVFLNGNVHSRNNINSLMINGDGSSLSASMRNRNLQLQPSSLSNQQQQQLSTSALGSSFSRAHMIPSGVAGSHSGSNRKSIHRMSIASDTFRPLNGDQSDANIGNSINASSINPNNEYEMFHDEEYDSLCEVHDEQMLIKSLADRALELASIIRPSIIPTTSPNQQPAASHSSSSSSPAVNGVSAK